MNKRTFTYILLFSMAFQLSAANITISGYLTDGSSGETLISGSVYDNISGKGVVSNVYGFYSLTLPSGPRELRYTYVGYQPQIVTLNLQKDTTIHIRLEPSTELSTVTILGSSRKEFGVLGSQMGAIEVPIAQIKAVPAMFGEVDLIKALQLLPGVQGGTEGSAGLYVRGGGPDENLLLLDGIPVYNVNHMGGFFSVFNADAIKNVTLYKGNFPARFGGRLSSVVDIRMNDGNAKEIHGNVSIGAISSKFNLEGPIIKDKTTFNFSYRRTYADLLIQPLIKYAARKEGEDPNNYAAGYYFYDLNTKISHRLSDKDRLSFSFYSGDDVIYMKTKEENEWGYERNISRTKLNWNWGNLISVLRWNHIVNSKLFLNTSASYTRYRFKMRMGIGEENYPSSGSSTNESVEVGYLSGISDYALRADFDYTPAPGHDVKFGGNYINHTFRPGVAVSKASYTEETATSIDTTIGNKNVFADELALYAEDNLSLGSFIKANIGVNYSLFQVQNRYYHSVEPRLSMRLLINENLSFKAGYASMKQYIHLLSNSSLSMPTDLWVPVTKQITPMESRQYSVGLFYNLKNIIDLSLESYYKSMDNLLEYKDGAGFLASSSDWEEKVCMGRGWSYGLEFLAQKTVGKTTGWLAYTWSKAERKFDKPGQEINNGKTFPAKYDRRHDISLTLNHSFSKRFELAGTWVYCTGNTGTLSLQQYKSTAIPEHDGSWFTGQSLDYVDKRNNYRMPAYHRMDLSANFHKQKKHGVRTWNISVYNAYNQLNPFVVLQTTSGSTYNPETGTSEPKKVLRQYSIFPIIPSLSYSYKF
jgi:hypothetical protein